MKIKILIGVLLSTAILLVWVLLKVDPACLPLTYFTAPEAFEKTYENRPLTVLVSYADGDPVFFQNQHALNASALNRGIDVMHMYRRSHMDSAFYKANKRTLTQARGSGYWLWKPYFILKTMHMYPDNTLILYADSGAVFTRPLDALFKKLKEHDRIFVGQGKSAPLKRHLKKEAQQALGIDQDEARLKGENIWAFFMALRNTPENRAFIKKWLDVCVQENLLTDVPLDPAHQDQDFEFHQHDQSLLSVVASAEPEKSLIIKKNDLRTRYGIINFHRHPHTAHTSPFLLFAGMPAWLNTVIFNNWLVQGLRRMMG